jgi:hypothetical protein
MQQVTRLYLWKSPSFLILHQREQSISSDLAHNSFPKWMFPLCDVSNPIIRELLGEILHDKIFIM